MAGTGAAPGERRGGRQKGSINKVTAEVRTLALDHGPAAIAELARLSVGAENENARISACNAILERAYGRALPGRPIILDLPDTSTIEGIAKAVAHVVQTAASGEITPAEANDFCTLLESQRRIVEFSDVERRLAALEAAQPNPGARR